jgi:hypothetical protein
VAAVDAAKNAIAADEGLADVVESNEARHLCQFSNLGHSVATIIVRR